MAKSAPETIILKGRGLRKEGIAASTIMPGHLVRRDSNGKYAVQNVAGGYAGAVFAVENELAGKEISAAYAANDQVFVEYCTPGMEVYALLAAAATAVVNGDLLEPADDGTLRKFTAQTDTDGTGAPTIRLGVRFRALESVDNSGGASPARIKVEVL